MSNKGKLVFVLFTFFSPLLLEAGLLSLQRSTPAETAFETSGLTTWNGPDDGSTQVNIGFSFPFNGSSYTQIYISTNGTLSFVNNSSAFNNTALSSSSSDDYNFFPYWEDMNPPNGGNIQYGTIGTGNNQHFVVWWNGIKRYRDSGSLSFQAVLYKDGRIRFRYLQGSNADGTYVGSTPGSDKDGGTVGIKEDANHYDQYIFDQSLDQSKDVLYSPIPIPTDNDYSDFHFDELGWDSTAGEIKDSHWNNHGRGYNVPSVPGKICQAMDLTADGTDDYAELGEGALDGVTNFTISVWHKGTSANSRELLSGANSSRDNEAGFWYDNSTRFNPDYYQSSVGQTTSTNINDGNWHHLVWRVNGNQSCYFFDGQSQGCKNITNHTLNIEKLILGQDQDSVGGGFSAAQDWEGIIDELLIFRKALTDNEIQSIYNNQNAGKNWDGTTRTCPYPTITKTSCVIHDPVLGTTKPKRIPGATIRYAIEVKNLNTSTMSNVIVKDSVSSYFDESTIKFLQIQSGTCDCLGVSSANNNGANGTGDGVNPVKLDYGSVSGNSKECGYFEVDIK